MTAIDKTIYQIALENRGVPGVQEAINWANRSSMQSFGSWTGNFKDYFSLLQGCKAPVRDTPASLLWMGIVNLIDDSMDNRDAINVFIGPLAEAMSSKMTSGDIEGVTSTEVVRLADLTGKASRESTWLTENNKESLKTLAKASVDRWLKIYEAQCGKGALTCHR